ncbi:TetR/AcrR family transcriptional regulator [Gordonia zhaorongruii]|uniref:TetR/AcrR family transcriptional regulator n=1 Tax=Gordonia zhaorongruii TaxID=2597659 RepID=UPI00104D27FD|nr:TetR/AcrR family transcriptional regulator [Gordonia zhaorongruii]
MATKAELTRQRLLAGAMTSFAENGFHGTSTRHIAAAAGMSPAAVYVHYTSKEELLYEITRLGHDEINRIVEEAVAADTTPSERMRRLIRGFVIYHAQHHASSRVVNYEMTRLSTEHLAEIVALRTRIDGLIAGLIRDGVTDGTFVAPDISMTTTAITSLGIDVARWFRTDRPWTPQTVGDHYADLTLRMLGVLPQN